MTLLYWALLLVPLAVDVGATVVCGLKRKRGFLVLGVLVVSLLTLGVGILLSLGPDWADGWEDVAVGITFMWVLLPTSIVLLVGAVRSGEPGSWWMENVSTTSTRRAR